MAGLGRRTHYRKHVTDSVLNDFPEPAEEEDESIAVIMATRGSNQFDVRLPHSAESQLAILPTKFRKLVWLKRNDYVIVTTAGAKIVEDKSDTPKIEAAGGGGEDKERAGDGTGTIRCMITHILYSEQIKHLKSKGLWPSGDPGFDSAGASEKDNQTEQQKGVTETDGIVYEQGYDDSEDDDDDLFVNTNRISKMAIQDDSSDSEDDG